MKNLLALALVGGVGGASAQALDADLSLNPRLESIQSDLPQSERALLKAEGGVSAGPFRLRGNFFAEADALSVAPNLRKSRADFVPQEGYAELRAGAFTVRAGMQAVRWSESWVVPSLDIWTGRRWNRLFYDPLAEQLSHPVGVLASLAGTNYELTAFSPIVPAITTLPRPLPDAHYQVDVQGGGRAKVRVAGFDAAAIYARRDGLSDFGGNLSYALDCCVPKLEAGSLSGGAVKFGTVGLDVFAGNWSLLPQFTYSSSSVSSVAPAAPAAPFAGVEKTLYMPLRYNEGSDTFELQYLNQVVSMSSFFGVLYGRDFHRNYRASVFAQTYDGSTGLFAIYRAMTAGLVAGVRLESFISF